MKCENQLNKVLPYLVVFFAVLTVMWVDYSTALGDIFRGGRIRYLLMGLAVCHFLYMRHINPWWAAFSAWSFFLWCYFDFSGFGAADVALITGSLLVGDVVRQMVSASIVLRALGAMALLQGAFACLQMLGIDPLFPNLEAGAKFLPLGTFGHKTILAPFLALGCVYYLSNWKWGRAAFLAICVALTSSSMGAGALAAGALYVLWRFRPALAYAGGALAVAGLLGALVLAPKADFLSPTGRQVVWPRAFQGVIESPVIGHGPGSFLENRTRWGLSNKTELNINWDQVHQEFLQAWIETGAIGLLIILLGLYSMMRICQRLHPAYGAFFVVLISNSMGNLTMHIATFGLAAGWLCAVVWQKRSE